MMKKANGFYFGCWDAPGHYLHNRNGATLSWHSIPEDFPVFVSILDGGLLPPHQPQEEGKAVLVHINAWTILTFWDRSVDKRLSSSSTFLFRGALSFDEIVEHSKASFPKIWARYTFPVTCVTNGTCNV